MLEQVEEAARPFFPHELGVRLATSLRSIGEYVTLSTGIA
jgi:hypothetical protein